jgi:hypothetical protein
LLRAAGTVVAVAALTTVLTACGQGSAAVAVSVPTGSVQGAACTSLAAQLPTSLDGRSRRKTSPTSDRVTAWGSPAVVLRCGVTAAADDTGDHVTVNGVAWRTAGPAKGVVVWTTTDRATGLELSVPDSIDNQETLLADLAKAVAGAVSRVPAPAASTASSATPSG